MRVASRFAIAVHILSLIGLDENEVHTSEGMAGSIGVNAVIVRNVTGDLRRAGLVLTRQGVAGARLGKSLPEITLLDVYRAVETDRELFALHPRPNPDCFVGANIQNTLEHFFSEAQQAMEAQLGNTTLLHVIEDLRRSPQNKF